MPDIEILKQKGYNFLWIDKYLWMWDVEPECQAQYNLAKETSGNILVAGYGLGIVQKYLLENPSVSSVTTIELHQKVLEECERVYGKLYGVVEVGDFYSFPETRRFDYVIGDIMEDILPAYLCKYKQFKKKAENLIVPDGKILAWGQEYYEFLIERKLC